MGEKQMKHFTIRTISTIMTIMMIVGFIAIPTFATDNNDPQEVAQSGFAEVDETQGGKEVATEDVAIIMESYIGEDQINDDVELENGEFSVNDSDMEVSIPENGDEVIVIQMEEGTIKMGLPDEVSNEAGILSENGTVIYDPDAENVAVGVHALYNGEGDNRWEAVRVLIEIKNADASKEYGFKFNLPEGCRLIEAERWFDLYISASSEDVVNKEEFFIPGRYILLIRRVL